MYIDKNDFLKIVKDKKVYVFGTGIDAETLCTETNYSEKIEAFIDNYRFGENRFFLGKHIISIEQFLMTDCANAVIVVASYRFAKEICIQLQTLGLIPSKDYYVWDENHLFCHDENTKELIQLFQSVWKENSVKEKKSKILIPFDNKHYTLPVIYAYCSNYFAQKYNASIVAYFRFGASIENASDVIKDIYSSFNVEEVIDCSLNEELKKEADMLVKQVWDTLYAWEDWKKITIYGIHFGTTIIRHFLRVHIPTFDLRSDYMYTFLKNSIYTIIFWYHYINNNDFKIVFLADGVSWDGYIRDIAISKGIPTYAIECKMAKMTLDFCDKAPYQYFGSMWNELSICEQKYGKKWAQKHIENRLKGGLDEVHYTMRLKNTLSHGIKESYHLEKNDKLKVVIFPHIFEEDCYWCGSQLFDDNYFSWLCNLGELSECTPTYDWYIKMHPCAKRRDKIIIDMLIEKYPKIKKIPEDISPIQLRDEGVQYALTVSGTIGQEFPEIGIQVIMAGKNPYSCFDFVWNPESKEEYNDLIYNLDKLDKKNNMDELYKFYSLNYLFYDWDYISYKSLFFNNKYLSMDRLELEAYGKKYGTWMYGEYIREWSKERHNEILNELEALFEKMDSWRPDILYKKSNYKEI